MNVNPAHWHLLLNHFPIILSVVGTLFLVLSMTFKKSNLTAAALLLLILGAISAIAANYTGEGAEEVVEEIAGVSHQSIHTHEEAAETGLKIILFTGLIAAFTGIARLKFPKSVNFMLILTLVAGLASSGYMGYVGLTGGEIRHSEIRGDFGRDGGSAPANQNPIQDEGEDDD